jgi:hypothetical protein
MKAFHLFLLVAALSLCFAGTGVLCADPPNVGSSQADLPSLQGEFRISNNTGQTIHYMVRWGNEPWKKITLQSGHWERHWYPLDAQRRAPAPQVRFDGVAQNHRRWTYTLEFYAVGYQGYGSAPDLTQAKEYYFKWFPSTGALDLMSR